MNETPSGTVDVDAPAKGPTTLPGALSLRHEKYAEDFKQWLLGLNRHDFGQVRRVLEQMTRAYFKHTIKVHSPPMKADNNDDSGKTRDGASNQVLSDPPTVA